MKLAHIVTMENLSESGAMGATEDALAAAETATDVAEGNAEVIEGAGEIDNLDLGIEDAFEAGDHIEELLEAAEGTMKEGGMTEQEAKLLEVSHESIMRSLGMSHRTTSLSKNPIVTIESYGSSQTRQSATIATIESLVSSGKNIVTQLIAALKAAWNTVSNFVAGLLRNRDLMDKHLSNLQAKVKALGDDLKPRAESFKAGAASLSVDGKASPATARQILQSASSLIAASVTIASSIKVVTKPDEAAASVEAALTRLPKHGDSYGHLTLGRSIKVKKEDGTISVSILAVVSRSIISRFVGAAMESAFLPSSIDTEMVPSSFLTLMLRPRVR